MIALDVDGILANFYLSVCRRFDKPYITVSEFYIKWLSFKEIENDEWFWSNLELLNPPEAITFEFDVYMTSLPESMIESRREWLLKNGFPDKPIIISHDKAAKCISMGVKLLIDDKPSTIQMCRDENIMCIQYIPSYSEMRVANNVTIKHLPEAKAIIESVMLFHNNVKSLPEYIVNQLHYIYKGFPFSKFKFILDLVILIYVECKTGEDVFSKVSRWDAMAIRRSHPDIFSEELMGKDKFYFLNLLIQEAKGSI